MSKLSWAALLHQCVAKYRKLAGYDWNRLASADQNRKAKRTCARFLKRAGLL